MFQVVQPDQLVVGAGTARFRDRVAEAGAFRKLATTFLLSIKLIRFSKLIHFSATALSWTPLEMTH
jgi:hypothetical protein